MLLSAMWTYWLAVIVDRRDITVMQLRLVVSVMQELPSVRTPLILLVACGIPHDGRDKIFLLSVGTNMSADLRVAGAADISAIHLFVQATAERAGYLIFIGVYHSSEQYLLYPSEGVNVQYAQI